MKKPKGIFLGNKQAVCNAFSCEVQNRIKENIQIEDAYYGKEYFENNNDFSQIKDAEYGFSTWGMPNLSENEISEALPNLKAVFYAAGSVRDFAVPFMNKGVKIFSARMANAVPVAEFTVSQILLANKGFFHSLHNGGTSDWENKSRAFRHPGNYDSSVGIIGAGTIGRLVINELKKHDIDIKVFDPFMSEKTAEEYGVEKTESLPDLFAKCHVVSNHLANNSETVNIIDKSCFEKADKNGVLINTGRGQQINENDMISALKNNPDYIAVLDVTYPEPPKEDSELYLLPNVFLTPHIAGSTGKEVQRMGEYMYDDFLRYLAGEETKYEVTMDMLSTMA